MVGEYPIKFIHVASVPVEDAGASTRDIHRRDDPYVLSVTGNITP